MGHLDWSNLADLTNLAHAPPQPPAHDLAGFCEYRELTAKNRIGCPPVCDESAVQMMRPFVR